MSITLGLFGCGTIGEEIARAVADGTVEAELAVAYDRNPDRRDAVGRLFEASEPTLATAPSELLDADLVIEAAGQSAVEEIATDALDAGRDCMLMSVGALSDADLRESVLRAAEEGGTLYVPSGAIAGLDTIKAAGLAGELESVSLTTTKPPAGLRGAPYVEERGIDLSGIDEAEVVFEGSATEAASAFPSNINVAMALSMAGIGPSATTVRIIADPDEENNVHRIEATGGMGELQSTVRNVPSPTNPKTSYLASLSAIEKLRGLTADVRVGT